MILAIGVIILLSGCAISEHVEPVDQNMAIQKVYILKNNKDLMDGFLPEMISQIKVLGFDSEAYTGERPEDAVHYITYDVNWSWDLATYLVYFDANLYEDGKIIGEVEYDARRGGANMGKFGHTAEKIRPLLKELFINVKRDDNMGRQDNVSQSEPKLKNESTEEQLEPVTYQDNNVTYEVKQQEIIESEYIEEYHPETYTGKRNCLNLPSNEEIIRCSESFR